MKKVTLIFLFSTLFWSQVSSSNQSDSLFGRRIGISAQAGSLGIGGSFNLRISKKIELSLSYSLLDISTKLETSFDGQAVDLTINNRNNYSSFIVNLYPSIHSSFHFLMGAIFSKNEFPINAVSRDSQSYQKIIFSPEQLGKLDFTFKGSEIMPVLGIGFGRTIPKNRLGIGLDLGAAYLGKLTSSISANKAFEPAANSNNEKVLNDAFSTINWYPFLQMKINFKIY